MNFQTKWRLDSIKIGLIIIWAVVFLYLLNILDIEKSLFNYIIAFFLLLVGVYGIDKLFRGYPYWSKSNKT